MPTITTFHFNNLFLSKPTFIKKVQILTYTKTVWYILQYTVKDCIVHQQKCQRGSGLIFILLYVQNLNMKVQCKYKQTAISWNKLKTIKNAPLITPVIHRTPSLTSQNHDAFSSQKLRFTVHPRQNI